MGYIYITVTKIVECEFLGYSEFDALGQNPKSFNFQHVFEMLF